MIGPYVNSIQGNVLRDIRSALYHNMYIECGSLQELWSCCFDRSWHESFELLRDKVQTHYRDN